MRRLDLLLLPENDLILLRNPEAANRVLEDTGKPGSSWAGRAMSRWSARLRLAIWLAGSV